MARDWIHVATRPRHWTKTTMDDVLKNTAEVYGVSVEAILGASRNAHICAARQSAAWLGHLYTNLSSSALARALGRADHTTALHSIKRGKERDTGGRYSARLSEIEARLVA